MVEHRLCCLDQFMGAQSGKTSLLILALSHNQLPVYSSRTSKRSHYRYSRMAWLGGSSIHLLSEYKFCCLLRLVSSVTTYYKVKIQMFPLSPIQLIFWGVLFIFNSRCSQGSGTAFNVFVSLDSSNLKQFHIFVHYDIDIKSPPAFFQLLII